MDALVECGVEDARHLAVANVVAALVGVRRNQRAVSVDILTADQHGELVALAVDSKRAVAGVVKDHGVALLRNIDEIFLHGGKNAVAGGLGGGKEDHAGAAGEVAPGW